MIDCGSDNILNTTGLTSFFTIDINEQQGINLDSIGSDITEVVSVCGIIYNIDTQITSTSDLLLYTPVYCASDCIDIRL